MGGYVAGTCNNEEVTSEHSRKVGLRNRATGWETGVAWEGRFDARKKGCFTLSVLKSKLPQNLPLIVQLAHCTKKYLQDCIHL